MIDNQMKTKLLPSLRERWKELEKQYISIKLDDYDVICLYSTYVQFTDKKPSLWMFVACKKELIIYPANFTQEDRPTHRYIPLEKPSGYDNWQESDVFKISTTAWNESCKQYQQALDRVIFDGFEIIGTENFYQLEMSNGFTIVYDKRINEFLKYKTIADLAGKVYLNKNGIKDSGI